jgi:hypothetical protein
VGFVRRSCVRHALEISTGSVEKPSDDGPLRLYRRPFERFASRCSNCHAVVMGCGKDLAFGDWSRDPAPEPAARDKGACS